MCPWPKLAAKARANEFCDDPHVFFRQPKHLRENAAHVEDPLRLLIDSQSVAFPDRDRRLQLDRVVSFRRRHISLIEFDWCVRQSSFGIPTLALQTFLRTEGSVENLRVIISSQIGLYVW